MELVIVESPGKVQKIQGILGSNYVVMPSIGHVRDLPAKELGVEPPTFAPHYVPTERGAGVLKKIKAAASSASRVLLASDPDREGEAIAWHVVEGAGLKPGSYVRIAFHEITEKAVRQALSSPREIDRQLVAAQEARRVLDRICGYTTSPWLSDALCQPASAGRVQSVALRLVCEREDVLEHFVSIKHFGVQLGFGGWTATWDTKPFLKEGEEYILDRELAERIAQIRTCTVLEYGTTPKQVAPPAPYITTTLQAAGAVCGFSVRRTMELAQRLYEQGLITYMRTDNPNLSDDAYRQIVALAAEADWPCKVVATQRTWKAKAGAQEAHECIRPTHFEEREAGETDDERALYRLIWTRAVASQLEDAIEHVTKAELEGAADDLTAKFTAQARRLVNPGWKSILKDLPEEAKEEDAGTLPDLQPGKQVSAVNGKVLEKATQPPKRYTEATLVAHLERLGIGRPSTYAAILGNISQRGYIEELPGKKGQLRATDFGRLVVRTLLPFGFLDYGFTRDLEDSLDAVASGKKTFLEVVSPFHSKLIDELARIPAPHPRYTCPECGKALRLRTNDRGSFWACTGYPDCHLTLPDDNGKPGARHVQGPPCPTCGKPLVRRNGKHGPFWSCSGYPDCSTHFDDVDGKPLLQKPNVTCPECGQPMRRLRGQDGYFWGCSGYPQCHFTLPDDGGKPGERRSTSSKGSGGKSSTAGKKTSPRARSSKSKRKR